MSTENQSAPLIPENSPSSVVEIEEQTEEKIPVVCTVCWRVQADPGTTCVHCQANYLQPVILDKPAAPADHVEAVLLAALTLLTNVTIQFVDQPSAPVTRIRELLRAEIEALLSEHRSGSTASGVSSESPWKITSVTPPTKTDDVVLVCSGNNTDVLMRYWREARDWQYWMPIPSVPSPVSPVSDNQILGEKDA